MNELTAKSAYAIAIHSDYGDNDHRYTKIIGVALTDADAHIVLQDAFDIAKNAFMDYMRQQNRVVYRHENNDKVEDFIILDNEDYKRISMHTPDVLEPFTEMVSVYIEETILYEAQPEIIQPELPVNAFPNMACYHDRQTDVNFMAGSLHGKSLSDYGFEMTHKLLAKTGSGTFRCKPNSHILFWKNESNGTVAISFEGGEEPVRIFNNRIDGNSWFRVYIKPEHGDKLIAVQTIA